MRTINDYRIIYHNINFSDSAAYSDVASGVGISEYTALRDALALLTQMGWDVDGCADLLNDQSLADNNTAPRAHVSVHVR